MTGSVTEFEFLDVHVSIQIGIYSQIPLKHDYKGLNKSNHMTMKCFIKKLLKFCIHPSTIIAWSITDDKSHLAKKFSDARHLNHINVLLMRFRLSDSPTVATKLS